MDPSGLIQNKWMDGWNRWAIASIFKNDESYTCFIDK